MSPRRQEQPRSREASQTFGGTFGEMVLEIVEYRELLLQLTVRDIRIRYKQAVMGFGWALLMPMLIVGAGFVIKYVMAQMAGTALSAQAFAGMGVKALAWAFFVGDYAMCWSVTYGGWVIFASVAGCVTAHAARTFSGLF